MHVLMWTGLGLLVLAAFLFLPLAPMKQARRAYLFIAIWFLAALVNGAIGIFKAGIPLINEVGAFIVIFGLPAAIAAYVARRSEPASF